MESPSKKKVHLSLMGGNPAEDAKSAEMKLGRIGTVYDVIANEIKKTHGEKILHVSMLPEYGTYGEGDRAETSTETKAHEARLGHDPLYPDAARFNTSRAKYDEWENVFKGAFFEKYLKPDHPDQEVDLTIDTWSLGTAFFVKFLSKAENRKFLEDSKVNIKGIHFIAPSNGNIPGAETTFSISHITEEETTALQAYISALKTKHKTEIFITANQHDAVLGGKGKEEAHELGNKIDPTVSPRIESHNTFNPAAENFDLPGLLKSHYVTDDPNVVGNVVERTKRMVEKNVG